MTHGHSKTKKTRTVKVGRFAIGGSNPVSVQSMCNTDTRNLKATVDQIRRLEDAGCEIIRVAVPDMEAAQNLGRIKSAIGIPLVADIHFDHRLALEAVRQGVDKIRINPGNIGDRDKVREVARACKSSDVPIRIGVNAGSLNALKTNPNPRWEPGEWAKMMVKEALDQARVLENMDFGDIVVSLKADDLERTVMANLLFSEKSDIPLHLGVTEAGSFLSGTVKSSLGIGLLLSQGVGDTVRVSLTEDPVMQVRAAYEILKALGLRVYGPNLISCPTCGRCQVSVSKIIHELEDRIYSDKALLKRSQGLKIAVMGCVVNGPGEARSADFGIAGAVGRGVWIEKGKQIKVVKESEWVNEIIRKIRSSR
ncbi:MAG: 4-hydroxy-3-methylbut-2-en-1-yl diphosphate synthase [Elusimicrobia bacterium GWF2_52_66]|nr:MAG: 4-hydroxy-3-methylbut-2-en-1-yl diphosphate synthase [Elusimicrobia bacterium GWA2_51_34]OGR85785.1 MAG: 4-hydroxy-3-methylbut-2-en-1-yl diphosphate synthase [Elusimicrobia bacterium GWF2_52_66]HAF96256.1 4-hydroxy-3-methylbut-2-en-1-yl diphosphate synthase [Elusimicrobiota bacterium]HCE97454.1 4-hydroxy-3-methylbut-2-en-1-yl diphosphate synthase [Elusimicrobiota bacterium]